MNMKRGFTIVELLVVIAVIGVLGGIVTNATVGAIRNARGSRANAMRTALEQAISTYYAQEGRWPDAIEQKISSGMDEDTYTFTASECDDIFRQVVGKGFGKSGRKSVLVDATALFVARSSQLGNGGKGCFDNHSNQKNRNTYCGNQKCIGGIDFSIATARSGKNHIRFNEMAFGYQGKEAGKFCRFWVKYNGKTDSVTVSK